MTSQLVAILAQIAAVQTRVVAMQAENQHRASVGLSIAYGEEAFLCEADLLLNLSIEARNI